MMEIAMSQEQDTSKHFNESWVWCKFERELPHTIMDEHNRSFGPYPAGHTVLIPVDLAWILSIHNFVKPTKVRDKWMIIKKRHTFDTKIP